MKFTEEEISLCKKIAEKHKKPIEYGDWYWDEGQKRTVICAVRLAHIEEAPYFIKNCFPLWTISDCLDFLNKRGWNAVTLSWRMEQVGDKPEIAYCEIMHDNFYEAEEKKAVINAE